MVQLSAWYVPGRSFASYRRQDRSRCLSPCMTESCAYSVLPECAGVTSVCGAVSQSSLSLCLHTYSCIYCGLCAGYCGSTGKSQPQGLLGVLKSEYSCHVTCEMCASRTQARVRHLRLRGWCTRMWVSIQWKCNILKYPRLATPPARAPWTAAASRLVGNTKRRAVGVTRKTRVKSEQTLPR